MFGMCVCVCGFILVIRFFTRHCLKLDAIRSGFLRCYKRQLADSNQFSRFI